MLPLNFNTNIHNRSMPFSVCRRLSIIILKIGLAIFLYMCIIVSVRKKHIAGWSSWQLVGLITRRSQVQVLLPQPFEQESTFEQFNWTVQKLTPVFYRKIAVFIKKTDWTLLCKNLEIGQQNQKKKRLLNPADQTAGFFL